MDGAGFAPLTNLYDASIAKMDSSGLLLAGTEIGNGRHGPMEWRQNWWCVLTRIEPA